MARSKSKRCEDAAAKRPGPPRRLPLLHLLLLAAVLTSTAILGGTAARYLTVWSDSSIVTAGDFYFTSQELDGSLHQLSADESSQTAAFTFTLKNYAVADHPTQNDISYTCSAANDNGAVAAVWNSGGSADAQEGTIPGKAANDKAITCLIPAEAFGAGSVTVTVTATEPYTKTLTAQVTLDTGDAVVLKVDNSRRSYDAVAVTFYNTGQKDCRIAGLKLKGDNDLLLAPESKYKDMTLVPDPTWETQADDTGALTVPAGGAVSVIFLKTNAESIFSESDFEFTVSEIGS